MTQFRDAFQRAAKNNPAFDHFQLFAKVDLAEVEGVIVPADFAARVGKTGLYDWVDTVPGALHWQDIDLAV